MTPSPPSSSKSSPSSRPSSSASSSTFHDSHTPRSSSRSGRHPLQRFPSSPTHEMGVAGPSRLPTSSPSGVYTPSGERPRLPRQTSKESIRPRSSTLPSQDLDEAIAGADHDPGTSDSLSAKPAASRQKKKRTRTLTTPHQSAVLHALLAQSRFPTTAMREEVGRSIGLSARKVQVWFQNQRQKARKPRNQSAVPLSRPPQFGPFISASQSERAPFPGSAPQFQSDNSPNMPPQQMYTSEQLPRPVHPSGLPSPYPDAPQYSLSNVLGHPSSQKPSFLPQPYQYHGPEHNVDPGPSSIARSLPSRFPIGPSPSQGPHFGPQVPFPPDAYDRRHATAGTNMTRSSEPPIVLPPLRFHQPHGSQTLPWPPLHDAESHLCLEVGRPAPPSGHSGSISSSSASHFGSPFTLPPLPRHSSNLPPPFTLQPPPQWGSSNPVAVPTSDMALPTPIPRSPRGPTARPRHYRTTSDPTRRLPPLSILLEQERSRDQPLITQPRTQQSLPSTVGAGGRRFDPVRSVLREGEAIGRNPAENDASSMMRRNRHSYDFTMPSKSAITPSPPSNPDNIQGESHRRDDEVRR